MELNGAMWSLRKTGRREAGILLEMAQQGQSGHGCHISCSGTNYKLVLSEFSETCVERGSGSLKFALLIVVQVCTQGRTKCRFWDE